MAGAPHLHDFYSVHLLNFCQGDFAADPAPDGAAPDAETSRHVTSCSSLTLSGSMNLRAMIEERTGAIGAHLLKSAWPEEIDRGLTALQSAQHAMLVLYIATIISTSLSVAVMLGARMVFPAKLGAVPTVVITLLETTSTVALGLASTLLTLIVFKTSGLISSWGGGLGVTPIRGTKLVVLTWGAWLAILGATAVMLSFSRCGKRIGL